MGLTQKAPPFRIVLNRDERPQGMLGGSLSHYVPPGAQYDYKPPSVFARYRGLTVIFALLILGILAYALLLRPKSRVVPPRAPAVHSQPASSEPIYVQPLEPVKR